MSRLNTLLSALLGLALLSATPALLADSGKGKGHDKGGQHDKGKGSGNDGYGSPSIDFGSVQVILNDNRGYWTPAGSLPPGIRKNLARGKPLPPGIAKKLDNRLIGRLPHYEGYEWRQAGADLVLVALATGVIYEVLQEVLD